MATLPNEVRGLLHTLESDADSATRAVLESALRRLDEPLRVAIAGRVKAGKSTLLNAVIGTPVASSDAAECTRFVTWYRHGTHPLAYAVDVDGGRSSVSFTPGAGIDVDGLDEERIARLEVEYPSPVLRDITLIDTPGIASISERVSQRSTGFLAPETQDQGADVLIYLLRFLHERDADFLEAFTDPSAQGGDPVRSVAVLSRADEVGSGRGDGFALARRAAERSRQHPGLRGHVSDVMPVSGLIGLHANGLTQRDHDDLCAIARLSLQEQEQLMLSVGRFVRLPVPGCPIEARTSLLNRLGFAGVRAAVAVLRQHKNATAMDLSNRLVALSGIEPFRRLLTDRYAQRADVLKASRAIDLMRTLVAAGHGGATARRELERIEVNAHEIVEIRALRDMARLEADSKRRTSITPDLVDLLAHALGAHGTALAQRLRIDPTADLDTTAMRRVSELRSVLNSPGLPRQWQSVVRTAIGSIQATMI